MYHLCARRQFTSIELLPYHSSKFFGGRWVGKLMSVTRHELCQTFRPPHVLNPGEAVCNCPAKGSLPGTIRRSPA